MFREKAYFGEYVVDTSHGKRWRWRIEFFPYHFVSGYENLMTLDYEPEWIEFNDEQLPDNISEISTKFSENIPVGFPSARSVKFSVNLSAFTSEGVESLRQLDRGTYTIPDLSPNSSFQQLNCWILRCDYGDKNTDFSLEGVPGALANAPVYFVGLQQYPGTTESTIKIQRDEIDGLKLNEFYEIEIVDALFEVNRQFKTEWLGDALLQYDPDAVSMRKYNASVYDFVKQSNIFNETTKTWVFGLIGYKEYNEPLRAITMSIADIRTIYTKYVDMYLRLMRVLRSRFPTIYTHGFLNYPFLQFYKQSVQFYTASPIDNDDIHIIVGTAVWNGSGYDRAYGGLFERGDKSGQLFEGETISDMLQNIALGFGHKLLYRNLEIRSTGLLESANFEDNILLNPAPDIDLMEDVRSDITIGTGEHANIMRSFILNTDIDPSDNNFTTWKTATKGNQSENDYEKKCVLHNMPRAAEFTLSTDGTIDFTPKRGTEIRNSMYLRRLFAHNDLDGYLHVADPNRLHEHCLFAVHREYDYPGSEKPPLWINGDWSPLHNMLHEYTTVNNGNKTYPSMVFNYINYVQSHTGAPNVITKALSETFIADNMFMLEISVEMSQNRCSTQIGEMYTIIVPSISRFADYNNQKAVLMEVTDNIISGTTKMKLLGIKQG